jgi:hypothetical protein
MCSCWTVNIIAHPLRVVIFEKCFNQNIPRENWENAIHEHINRLRKERYLASAESAEEAESKT